jgi:hypothetical protein
MLPETMVALPQLIDQFETLWTERIAPHGEGGAGVADELDRLQSGLRLPASSRLCPSPAPDRSQSKRVFPNLACSLADADRLTEELPGLLAQKGFGSIHMKNRSFAIGETVDTVYFVDLASGLEDPMAFSLCRAQEEEGYYGRSSMIQVFLDDAKRKWGG